MGNERDNEAMVFANGAFSPANGASTHESGANSSEQRPMAVLVVTAVDAEREAVLRGIAGAAEEALSGAADSVMESGADETGSSLDATRQVTGSDAEGKNGSMDATVRQVTEGGGNGISVYVRTRGGPVSTEMVAAPSVRFDVIAAGVGPAYAAASTAAALACGRYDLVVSAGIGGGFPGVAEIGSLVVADAIIAADLGAETADGQLTLDELGFGTSRAPVDAAWSERIAAALTSAGLKAASGPILTVSLATGRAETMELRRSLVPGAAAEGMEGYGVAIAADARGIPCAELRAISNAVGPRDRSAWRIGDALTALESAFRAIASQRPPRKSGSS